MRRFERRRHERLRRTAIAVGLSFALGALTALGLAWRLEGRLDPDTPYAADPEPAHDPTAPRPVERPGERGEAPPVGTTGAVAHATAVALLRDRDLAIPVAGADAGDLRDTFFDARDGRAHEALDIMAPRHTPVRAVDDGTIVKVFFSKGGGGHTIYQFDPSQTFSYYYAHLDRYAAGLHDGQIVRRGETLGYVGSTGNASADAPHLHFGIYRLTPARQWWKGEPINPYSVFR